MNGIVIIGSGMAGYAVVRETRKLDSTVPITLISADDGAPYPKPMLSTALAQGKQADQLAMGSAAQQAERLKLTLLTDTRVERIDPAARQLVTDQGSVDYDQLVLAVGAAPIRPPMQGDGVDRVLSINNLADYRRFRSALQQAQRIAIIGPGLIGCEFANDLIGSGHPVTLIGPDPYPISTLLPEVAGTALQQAMSDAGADWRLGTVVEAANRNGDAIRLTLSDGSEVNTDLVLSAVGLRPDTLLAEQAGLKTGRGIQVDRLLRSSDPNIYAIGDCAEVAGLNLPFVQPIMHGARALAATLTGTPTDVTYPAMPVAIKTPIHPVVTSPPPRDAEGEWAVERSDQGIKALFTSASGELLGFVLTGSATAESQALTKGLPPLLA